VTTAERHTWAEVARYYEELFGLRCEAVDEKTRLYARGDYDPGKGKRALWQLRHGRVFHCVMDNRKVPEVTDMEQNRLTALCDGFERERKTLLDYRKEPIMKAILVEKDKSLSWSDVPDPELETGQVLVKIHYAALNRADLMQREGNYPPPPGSPPWMGLEISGVITQVGAKARKNSRWQVGDRVCALLGGGGYAQYVAVPWEMVMPVPENCSMEEAAALPEAAATAYLNLFIEGQAQMGDTLLMHAGASGLASVAIPMAKAFDIRVITTVRSQHNARAIEYLGADIVVCTDTQDIAQVLREQLEAGHPVDLAIDCLGGEAMGECLPYMRRGGRWIMIATLAGDKTTVDLKNIYVRNIRIIGSTLRSRTPQVKAQILARLVRDVWPKVTQGKIRPTIYKVLPITQAQQAQEILYRGGHVGKVVLKVQ
jgi:NADPH2:quinone reductase